MSYTTRAYERLLASRAEHGYYMPDHVPVDEQVYEVVLPDSWVRMELGPWVNCGLPEALRRLPEQGWKIHISSIPREARDVLKQVAQICFQKELPFKYLRSQEAFLEANAKYAPRSGSGKFITIYPRDQGQLEEVVNVLEFNLWDRSGPYILSDVKFQRGPVFLRYGAFVELSLHVGTDIVYAIRDKSDRLVEDVRAPWFHVPEFATIPPFMVELVEDRLHPSSSLLADQLDPYSILSAKHFSNAGGVYEAISTQTGQHVIIKEGRAWAGLTSLESHGYSRVENESKMLKRLQGFSVAPAFLKEVVVEEHYLLVEELVVGVELDQWISSNYPLISKPDTDGIYATYARVVAKNLTDAVLRMHSAGVVHRDIQPRNILVTQDLEVRLIDFETATDSELPEVELLGTPGFRTNFPCSVVEQDLYGLARVIEYMFWPSLKGNFGARSDPLPEISRIKTRFGNSVSEDVKLAFDRLSPAALKPSRPEFLLLENEIDVERLMAGLATGIEESSRVNPQRITFAPADIAVFDNPALGPLSVENGAAGILLALHHANLCTSRVLKWLQERFVRISDEEALLLSGDGLWRGLPGVIEVLAECGELQLASEVLSFYRVDNSSEDLSMRTGLSGSILGFAGALEFGLSNAEEFLSQLGYKLTQLLASEPKMLKGSGELRSSIGLFDGWLGVGLACKALHHLTGESRWACFAVACADKEVENLARDDTGAVRVDHSGIQFTYLSEGVAGVAYGLAAIDAERYQSAILDLVQLMQINSSLNGGLFNGLLGISAVNESLRRLGWNNSNLASDQLRFVISEFLYRSKKTDAFYFLGDHSYALSCDLSTGAAGLMVALSNRDANIDYWFPGGGSLRLSLWELVTPVGRCARGVLGYRL